MILGSIHRCAAPVALVAFLSFGCATVRAPASFIGDDVQVGSNGASPQVELWLESGGPVSEAEKAQAVAQVREALDRATATLATHDEETLLVVRAQGIARTGSRKANQQAAKVGIVVGAAALIAVVVVAAVAGKGGGGSVPKLGGGALKVASAPVRVAPKLGGGFHGAPPRFFVPNSVPSVRRHGHAQAGFVAVDVQVPVPAGSAPPAEPVLAAVGPVEEPVNAEERTAFPPAQPVTLHLPAPSPLDVSQRKFFDKDYTRLELLVIDRDTGWPTWAKTVDGKVDPRDAAAVKELLTKAVGEQDGWLALGSVGP